ncbi:MAG: MFS transporter [Bacteriovorax sp.]|nr:MFS transporter [Bacteriovorax sp.]
MKDNSWRLILGRLFTGHFISMFGTMVFNASLLWWISEKTGSTSSSAKILLSASVPLVFLNLFTGTLVDRWNKKWILVGADILAGLSCVGLYLVAQSEFNINLVMFYNFIITLAYAFFSPCARAIIPSLIPIENIQKVNSVLSIGMELSRVAGSSASGYVLFRWGAPAAFLVNAASFFISALFEMTIPYVHIIRSQKKTILEDLKTGFYYVFLNKNVYFPLLLAAIFNFFAMGSFVAMPLYLKVILGEGSPFYGVCLGLQSAGALISSVYLLFLSKKETSNLKLISILGISGIAIASFGFSNKILFAIAFFIFGVCLSQFNVRFFSCLQKSVASEHLGKTMASVFLIAGILIPLGQIFFGWYGKQHLNTLYIFSGIGIIVCSFLLSLFQRKSI